MASTSRSYYSGYTYEDPRYQSTSRVGYHYHHGLSPRRRERPVPSPQCRSRSPAYSRRSSPPRLLPAATELVPVAERVTTEQPATQTASATVERTQAKSSSELDYSTDSESIVSESTHSASPDAQVESKAAVSTYEDMGSFAEHIARMTSALSIETRTEEPKTKDPVFCILQNTQTSKTLVPFLPTLSDTVHETWKNPASAHPTAKKLESMYRVREEDAKFLFSHPVANSIIVKSSQSHGGRQHSTPSDKEGKKLDSYGRRVYSSSSMGLKVSNYQAIMARYQMFLTEKIGDLCDYLPDEKRELARVFQKESTSMAALQMNTSRHQADSHARSMVASVALRRHAWLRSMNLSMDSKAQIEDLPFDGEGLFHATTDDSMDAVQKALANDKKMGLSHQPMARPYRQRRWGRPPYPTQPFQSSQPFRGTTRQPRNQQPQALQRSTFQQQYRGSRRGGDYNRRRV